MSRGKGYHLLRDGILYNTIQYEMLFPVSSSAMVHIISVNSINFISTNSKIKTYKTTVGKRKMCITGSILVKHKLQKQFKITATLTMLGLALMISSRDISICSSAAMMPRLENILGTILQNCQVENIFNFKLCPRFDRDHVFGQDRDRTRTEKKSARTGVETGTRIMADKHFTCNSNSISKPMKHRPARLIC